MKMFQQFSFPRLAGAKASQRREHSTKAADRAGEERPRARFAAGARIQLFHRGPQHSAGKINSPRCKK